MVASRSDGYDAIESWSDGSLRTHTNGSDRLWGLQAAPEIFEYEEFHVSLSKLVCLTPPVASVLES